MLIEIEFGHGHKHDVVIKGSYKDGQMIYVAALAETGFLSHFNENEDYSGSSVEEAIGKIAKGIAEALDQMYSF